MASQVHGSFAFNKSGVNWLLGNLEAWFYPMFLIVQVVAIALLPSVTARRYIKEYKLWGLVWLVYDNCFGLIIIAAAVLAMWHGEPKYYLAVLLPLLLNCLGQIGGVVKKTDRVGPAAQQPGAPPVPIAAYNVVVSGEASGPFDIEALSQLAAKGKVTADSLVWASGHVRLGKSRDNRYF